ncbi:uncharacterized protein NP_2076A [Natronomonas pharaonis DSM 2160]|uniref:DUF7552 domain-containing protein n=1 Tax=Natronomonas pharaonis (strain ATCC 35678 / DSM 2160 / CIP 103997 / JCM 8858 / NBRC 14720 / NCIMB 2260 / Gabara) TaxID=348780 RepID=A0A1U7EVP5_NATPD|nr:hypothetical protein [Natronomonas pharaonis]CAI49129.1 uncharacterized protein NP_2076A [Natronomonas pharaonis DSM 2160]
MNERMLRALRRHIESLADPDGTYVVCSRTGERPVPADGLRFRDCLTAREAARLAAQYRTRLRRYDRRLPRYDLTVRQSPGDSPLATTDSDADRPAVTTKA